MSLSFLSPRDKETPKGEGGGYLNTSLSHWLSAAGIAMGGSGLLLPEIDIRQRKASR